MVFQILSVLVPLILFVTVPIALRRFPAEKRVRPWLYLAGFLFCIAYYIPSPIIDGMETHFWTHFIGGGIFSGLFLTYITKAVNRSYSLAQYGVWLFALTSTLGVMNELAEFALVKLNLANITLADTSWDLTTNTLGAAFYWLIIVLVRFFGDRWYR